jgi:mono/diheme cytochrome c family protein
VKKTNRIWKILAISGGVILGAALLIQFLPVGGGRTNPAVAAEPDWDSPRTQELFMRACGDCHSNETVWPWYSRIAPVSWMVANHVHEGRSKLNVSEWGQGRNEADEAAEALMEGEMPLPNYLMLHPEARLSAAEKDELARGLVATFGGKFGDEGQEGED